MPWGRGRDRGWHRLRTKTLMRDPICRLGYPGCTVVSTMADHVIGIASGGVDTLENLQGVCSSCHALKTQTERTAGRWPSTRTRPREQHPGR